MHVRRRVHRENRLQPDFAVRVVAEQRCDIYQLGILCSLLSDKLCCSTSNGWIPVAGGSDQIGVREPIQAVECPQGMQACEAVGRFAGCFGRRICGSVRVGLRQGLETRAAVSSKQCSQPIFRIDAITIHQQSLAQHATPAVPAAEQLNKVGSWGRVQDRDRHAARTQFIFSRAQR